MTGVFTLRSSGWAVSLECARHQCFCVCSLGLHISLPSGIQTILPRGCLPGCQHLGAWSGKNTYSVCQLCLPSQFSAKYPNLPFILVLSLLFSPGNKQLLSNFGGVGESLKRLCADVEGIVEWSFHKHTSNQSSLVFSSTFSSIFTGSWCVQILRHRKLYHENPIASCFSLLPG